MSAPFQQAKCSAVAPCSPRSSTPMPAASSAPTPASRLGVGEVGQQVRVGGARRRRRPGGRRRLAGRGGGVAGVQVAVHGGQRRVGAGVAQRRRAGRRGRTAPPSRRRCGRRSRRASIGAPRASSSATMAGDRSRQTAQCSAVSPRPFVSAGSAPASSSSVAPATSSRSSMCFRTWPRTARPRREQHAQALEIGVLGRVVDRLVVVDPRAGVDEQAGEGRIVVVAGRAVETRERVARIPRRLEGGVGIGAAGEQPPRDVEEGRPRAASRAGRSARSTRRWSGVIRSGPPGASSASVPSSRARSTAGASPRTSAWNGLAVASAGVCCSRASACARSSVATSRNSAAIRAG